MVSKSAPKLTGLILMSIRMTTFENTVVLKVSQARNTPVLVILGLCSPSPIIRIELAINKTNEGQIVTHF